MKKILLFVISLLLILPAFSQETSDAPVRKQVTITKTWTDDQGKERTITITKEAEDTPENADWLESEDITAPSKAEVYERSEQLNEDVDSDFPWKDIPGELRIQIEDLSQEMQERWPEIEYELRKGTDKLFLENGRPLSKQAFLGVVAESAEGGVRVLEVVEGSAAEAAGLQPDDVIESIADRSISSPEGLAKAIRSHKPDETIDVHIRRNEDQIVLQAQLGRRAPEGMSWMEREFPKDRDYFTHGKCAPKAQLGVMVNDQEKGVNIIEVFPGSAAEKAGLKVDDIIYQIDDTDIQTASDLIRVIGASSPGDQVELRILRNGVRENKSVTLGKMSAQGCCPPGCCQKEDQRHSMKEEEQSIFNEMPKGDATLELKDLRIFPNPTSDEVQVRFRSGSDAPIQVRLLDASGRAFQVVEMEGSDSFDETFRIGDQPAGNYTLLIEQNGQFLTRTIIRNE
ncbi:MAG: PDZ domain-containing protein [Saprospiraceae bacterium]|nr:PDZ domain-containing protein [Saprospiraceae bacterium]